MSMPPYTIWCYEKDCGRPALYKIAARWSDGLTSELKTYGLTCEQCLARWFERSLARQKACRRAANEVLEPPGIYRLVKGQRDVQLDRLPDIEARLLATMSPS